MSPVNPAPALRRQYPHVDDIKDWRAQQSIRLLWDRVFDLETRLQATEATTGDLVSRTDAQDDQLQTLGRQASDTAALLQITRRELEEGIGTLPGEATIPDYSDIVATVLARYNPVIPEAQAEEGKAQLTRAVAWEIFQIDPNIGLFYKDYGAQVLNLSTDLVVQKPDGSYADVASHTEPSGGTVTILGTWGAHAGDSNTTDMDRWVEPTAALADTAGPMTIL